MERHGDEVELNETEASGGSKPHIVRYVLGISLALAIVALSAAWMTGTAFTSPQDDTVRTGVENN